MNYLFHGLVGVLVSVVMSLPVGPVNLAIVQGTIDRGKAFGYRIAAGSALAELFYCLLAVGLVNFLFDSTAQRENTFFVLQIASIPLLATLGVVNLLKKAEPKLTSNIGAKGGYFIGLSLNMANPALLLLWTAITTFLKARNIIIDDPMSPVYFPSLMIYSLGVATGTFGIQALIARLSARRASALNSYRRKLLTRAIGFAYLGFAIYQIFDLYDSYQWADFARIFGKS